MFRAGKGRPPPQPFGETVLTTEQLKGLARASVRWVFSDEEPVNPPFMEGVHALALETLGHPSDDDVITPAVQLLTSADRNDRVAALRVLGWYLHDARAAEAV